MKNLLRWCIDNPVAVNLIVIITCIAGFIYLGRLNREVFPEFSLDRIYVQVIFPGASPEEVEEGICVKIEESINGISGIKRIESTARESVGTVVIEIETGEDIYRLKDEIESQVNQINTFPEDAEKPIIRDLKLIRQVMYITVSGDVSEETLRSLTEQMKDELLLFPEISQVYITGLRDYEISIELSEETMKKYGVTSQEIGNAIRRNSLDLSGGVLKTNQGEVLLRVKGQKYVRQDFEDIIVKTNSDGAHIYLHQLAKVKDTFEESRVIGFLNGQRAALINVSKTSDEDVIKISDCVKSYIAEKCKFLPPGIHLDILGDTSEIVQSRLDLLSSNAIQGLILVFLCLALCLDLKLAWWVMMGMPISFLGTFIILVLCGQSLNMLSMFALIICLGIIVDDSIVISENIHNYIYEEGMTPKEAAVEATYRVFWPVVACVTTTVVAFLPLYAVTGIMGKFIAVVPTAVVATLLISLVEAVLVLPNHLAYSLHAKPTDGTIPWTQKLSTLFDVIMNGLIKGYCWLLRIASEYRYATLGAGLLALLLCFGLAQGGIVKFIVFPKMDSDYLAVRVMYPEGTSHQLTEQTITYVERRLWEVNEQMKKEYNRTEDVVLKAYRVQGQNTDERGNTVGSNLAEIAVELQKSEQRKISSEIILNRWRDITGSIPGVTSVTFGTSSQGPGGKPIQVQFRSNSFEALQDAAKDLKQYLRHYQGVYDIQDDFKQGYKELRFVLKPEAHNLNLTLSDLATQVRYAVYGNEILRIQRGKFDVRVYLRYPQEERQYISDMEKIFIRTATGQQVPILEVADLHVTEGYSLIKRVDGKRIVNVMADLDERKANASEITQELVQSGTLDQIDRKHGVTYAFEGQRKESNEALSGLGFGFMLGLLGIYAILATIFKSYIQPVVIMMSIPFGLVGAVLGHWIMGFPITLMSMFGIVALSGIVVDNSVVMIDFINEALGKGHPIIDAIVEAGSRRFRAIFLTSITTIVGICPLMFGQSLQAQYLIPMAISIAFGLLFSAILTLLIVPSIFIIVTDFLKPLYWVWYGKWPTAREVYGK